jgi:hypothetical protein
VIKQKTLWNEVKLTMIWKKFTIRDERFKFCSYKGENIKKFYVFIHKWVCFCSWLFLDCGRFNSRLRFSLKPCKINNVSCQICLTELKCLIKIHSSWEAAQDCELKNRTLRFERYPKKLNFCNLQSCGVSRFQHFRRSWNLEILLYSTQIYGTAQTQKVFISVDFV